MTDQKDKSGPDSFSDSSELFESLFKEAPLEDEKKPRRPPGARKPLKPAQELRRKGQGEAKKTLRPTQEAPPVGPAMKRPGDAFPPRRPLDFSRTGSKSIAPAPAPRPPAPKDKVIKRTRSPAKRGKGSKVLKLVLLLFLLGAGGAAGAGYLGLVDFGPYIGLRGEPDPVLPEMARMRPEKKSPENISAGAVPERERHQSVPQKAESTGGRTEPQAPETRQTVAPSGDKATVAERPGAVAVPPLQETLPAPPALSPKVVHQPPRPAPNQQAPAKSAPPSQPLPLFREVPAQYPFSVYLGAYRTLGRSRTAVSIYKRDYGISSHWVKVDLGEKGTWYRIFTGHFRTEQEAEAFIREKQLKEGEVKHTKFSTLVGVYSEPGDAEESVRRLLEAGYSSYFVPVPEGGVGLYSGAFYTLAGARNHHDHLASKGIESRVVER